MVAVLTLSNEQVNPLDILERVAAAHEWSIDRSGEDEVNLLIQSAWTDLHICINWRDDLEGLHLACGFDLRVPPTRQDEVAKLIALINEQLLFGHFDLWKNEGTLIFRNGLLLSGGVEVTESQCEALITLALESCERFYPAFQFVIWAGQSASSAMEACLLETQGEA
ncbi:YbjN domain-containing protein [Rhodoligotrophos ferricapiens]|uniref:YbjN domain-containing protein n=1 Tax=Rhodoligotrophos ferricapiens TaxID=3069264 RepID=UPI00315D4691